MAKKKSTSSSSKKKSSPKKQTAKKLYEGPAVEIEIEEGGRVEGGKPGEPVVNADAATGELIDPPGKIQAQKVGS